MPSLFEKLYRWAKNTPLVPQEFNKRFESVDTRLVGLEEVKIGWEVALATVQDRVLSRSEDVIASLRDKLLAITNLAWLTAHSATSATLAEGASVSLIIEPASRELFAPGPFAIVMRDAAPSAYAIVTTADYSRQTGQWDVRVETSTGLAGAHADWSIAAIAGSTLAQMTLLAEGKAARDDTIEALEDVQALAVVVGSEAGSVTAKAAQVAADKVAAGNSAQAAQQSATAAATFDPATYATKAELADGLGGKADAATTAASIAAQASSARAYSIMIGAA
jgi:hypothetical protein